MVSFCYMGFQLILFHYLLIFYQTVEIDLHIPP
nr:MAG TPA: hypothetical protein [Caudoviricetes sp.]DAJ41417.1 MAG TPA: hypothetical protein [Caudoviricetes sp.]